MIEGCDDSSLCGKMAAIEVAHDVSQCHGDWSGHGDQ